MVSVPLRVALRIKLDHMNENPLAYSKWKLPLRPICPSTGGCAISLPAFPSTSLQVGPLLPERKVGVLQGWVSPELLPLLDWGLGT